MSISLRVHQEERSHILRCPDISIDDDTYNQLELVSQQEDIWDIIFNYVKKFKARDVSYYHLNSVGSYDFDDKYFACRGREDVDIRDYKSKVFVPSPSFTPKLRLLNEPIFFSKFFTLQTLTEPQLDLMRSFHLQFTTNGVILPLHAASGRGGCIVISFDDENRRHSKSEVRRIHAICQYAHRLYCSLRAASKKKLRALTKRERQILKWVAQGKSNSVIADIIGISSHTVNSYLRIIYLKTDTSDRTSATLRGISEGLIY